tara:strand:+ start:1723 stop:1941 length:219 start_codon:yes stop_codon:yes gene_type:complete
MTVKLSSNFTEYTAGEKSLKCTGGSIRDLLHNLDQKFSRIRFRIVNDQKHNSLDKSLKPKDTIHLIGALIGA